MIRTHTSARAGCGPLPQPILENLEPRQLFSSVLSTTSLFRSLDGSGNNLLHPDWGAAGTALLRLVASEYGDGLSSPTGSDRPSAREISNAIAAHPDDEEMPSSQRLAAFAYLWGQFIDHDLDLTTNADSPAEAFNVPVPLGDPQFDINSTGDQVIGFNRSKYLAGTGITTPRQQVNEITSFLDGSMIYGSSADRAAALREFVGGRLLVGENGLLPLNDIGLPNANDAHIFEDDELYMAGDVRANENIELTAIHTLFMREHNRIAAQYAAKNPQWTDEQLYQAARRMVIAEVQSITYNEFLPALLGNGALPRYTGYKSSVNPGISNEFSTAAFRLGHSMLADDVEFLKNDGTDFQDEIPLAQAFFNPGMVEQTGIDPILKYLASSNAEEIDNKVVDGVRNFLFGPPGAGGFDLASLNIQRGRDHGLADYNATRVAMGLKAVKSFDQITSDPQVAATLQSLYGSVDNIDLWVGGLAEDHVRGSNLGPTFQRILVNQFTRLRDGDRFWYERDLNGWELSQVRNTRLSDIIKRNTGVTNLQSNVFVFNVQVNGRVFNDRNGNGRLDFRDTPAAGVTVQVVDGDGVVVDSTVTSWLGGYRFDGMGLGSYSIQVVAPDGAQFTTEAVVPLSATRGLTLNNVNFGIKAVSVTTKPTFPPIRQMAMDWFADNFDRGFMHQLLAGTNTLLA